MKKWKSHGDGWKKITSNNGEIVYKKADNGKTTLALGPFVLQSDKAATKLAQIIVRFLENERMDTPQ